MQPVIQDYGLGSISLAGLRTPQWIPELLIPVGLTILTIQLLAKLVLGVCPRQDDPSSPSQV
jgi:TRAP-type mannitol/chloroaromatic compound transport system permease small subunit